MNVQTVIKQLSPEEKKLRYTVEKDSQFTLVLLYFGEKDITTSVSVYLTGSRSKATIVGCIQLSGGAQVDLKTYQVHQKPQTTSDLLIKTVLHGESSFTYQGDILVEKDAQKTDAYQRNENMLLSPDAWAKSSPVLEILANDVRCTHGATTGPIDEDQLWYMASRAIPPKRAEKLFVEGFFLSALERIDDAAVKANIWQKISSRV